jgi:cytidylate kinase
VRAALLDLQRKFGAHGGVVLEGRDIGTVVFPDAEVKVFLTATDEERAERRFRELQQKGVAATLSQTLEEVRARDRQDSERAVAPLRPADDAIRIDSSRMSIDEVVTAVVKRARERERRTA